MLFFLALLCSASGSTQYVDVPDLLHHPRSIELLGRYVITPTHVVLHSDGHNYDRLQEMATKFVREANAALQANANIADAAPATLMVTLNIRDTMSGDAAKADEYGLINGVEAYDLVFEDGNMTINAPTTNGLFYGTQTALQLLRGMHDLMPSLRIRDSPVSVYRGVMIDNVRNRTRSSSI